MKHRPFTTLEVANARRMLAQRAPCVPVTTSVEFFTGEYVCPAFHRSWPDAGVERLLHAAFAPGIDRAFAEGAWLVSHAVLSAAGHVCAQARLGRYAPAEPREIPGNSVVVDAAAMNELVEADPTVLDRLADERLAVSDGKQWLFARPAGLLDLLRKLILERVAEYGVDDVVNPRLDAVRLRAVRGPLARFGWERIPMTLKTAAQIPGRHELWMFDDDAVALISVVDRSADPAVVHRALAPSINELIEDAADPAARAIHLIAVDGPLVRPQFLPEASPPVRLLIMSIDDLDVVSCAERSDPQCLWRYLADVERDAIRGGPATDLLEPFAVWRANHHSFYVSDRGRPADMLEHALADQLRLEVRRQEDVHSVQMRGGNEMTRVRRRFPDLDIPWYVAEESGETLIEGTARTTWIVADDEEGVSKLDCVAFWIWEITRVIGAPGGTVRLRNSDGGDIEVRGDRDGVIVAVRPLAECFGGVDNTGERQLVRMLLEALRGDRDVDALLDRVAPLGFKRMTTLSWSGHMRSLDGRSVDGRRSALRESDDGQAMDERGIFVREVLGLSVGTIADDQKADVVRRCLQFHVAQIAELLARVAPADLLERLLATYEGQLYVGAFNRHLLPTRIACFGDIADVRRRYLEQVTRHAAEMPALRFAIEVVAGCPPSGREPVTQATLDRLVALASQVVTLGQIGDILRDGLDDVRVSVLESGRLGIGRDSRYFSGRERFFEDFLPNDVARSESSFRVLFGESDPNPVDPLVAAIDEAGRDEWGVTYTEMAEVMDVLADLADGAPVYVAKPEELEHHVVHETSLDAQAVATLLDHLSMGPRPGVLKAPVGFIDSDLFPWRYSRRLSLVQRPLVRRPTSDGGGEIVYGPRAVDSAIRAIADDLDDGRYKATSKRMTRAMSAKRRAADDAFNKRVADRMRDLPRMVVREEVWKIGRVPIARPDGNKMGDLDVVAADLDTKVLHLAEVKNLAGARTPIEVAREVKRIFETTPGAREPCAADKHMERAAWVIDHLTDVLAWLEVPGGVDDWTVQPCIVTSTEVLGAYIAAPELPVYELEAFAEAVRAARDA